jgi:hypothetical protein
MAKNMTYPEVCGNWIDGYQAPPPMFPDRCPGCGARVAEDQNVGTWNVQRVYRCGGRYRPKPQIQNHTDIWWGHCGLRDDPKRGG